MLLTATGMVKRYGGVEALRGADFDLDAGEIVALVGDNGAGKSTLVKVLSGFTQPDAGQILLHGVPATVDSPQAAHDLGIETVYQDLALAPDLDESANIFLGRERLRSGLLGRLGVLDNQTMRGETRSALTRLGIDLGIGRGAVANLSGGQRQSIAVARAATWAREVLFLDEPTAALGVVQTAKVLELIRRVRDTGIGIVLISHSMPDVFAVADRIQVMRLGQRVAQLRPSTTSMEEIVGAMTGAVDGERVA